MIKIAVTGILCCVLMVVFQSAALAQNNKKQIIVGYIEKVHIPAIDLTLKAKLDTGARTSSINANIIETHEPLPADDESGEGSADDGRTYITFSIQNDGEQIRTLKKPVVRFVRIKKKEGGFIRRPVVEMTLCVAGQLVHGEVNLAKRDHYIYDLLIGRNMLVDGQLIIDATRRFTANPNCAVEETVESDS